MLTRFNSFAYHGCSRWSVFHRRGTIIYSSRVDLILRDRWAEDICERVETLDDNVKSFRQRDCYTSGLSYNFPNYCFQLLREEIRCIEKFDTNFNALEAFRQLS